VVPGPPLGEHWGVLQKAKTDSRNTDLRYSVGYVTAKLVFVTLRMLKSIKFMNNNINNITMIEMLHKCIIWIPNNIIISTIY
jgi:hypothetical protein